jgi:hypothetical protein
MVVLVVQARRLDRRDRVMSSLKYGEWKGALSGGASLGMNGRELGSYEGTGFTLHIAVRSCGSLGLSCRTSRDELRRNGTR